VPETPPRATLGWSYSGLPTLGATESGLSNIGQTVDSLSKNL